MRLSIDDGKEFKNLGKAFQAETVTFKELDTKQKREYIWDYYKWPIIVTLCVIALAIVVVPQILDNLKPTKLYLTMVNCEWSGDKGSQLLNDYAKAYDIDTEEYKLTADTSTVIIRDSIDNYSMESAQKLVALIANNTIDTFVSDMDNHMAYSDSGTFFDLRDILDAEFIELYADKLVYTVDSDTGEEIPYGIYVEDLKAFQDAYLEEAVLGVILNSENVESAVDFIYYVFEYNK